MTNALYRDNGIGYSSSLKVPDYTFDPTMHLWTESIKQVYFAQLKPQTFLLCLFNF